MSLTMHKFIKRDTHMKPMKPWNVLVEATIQGVKLQGTITCMTGTEDSAKKLACMTFISQLREVGVWTHIDEIDEPYEVITEGPKDDKGKSTKQKEIKYKKVTRYHAPHWDHVEAIEIIENNSRDLTFPIEEFEAANAIPSPRKRRTTNEAALVKRNKKQASIEKKDQQLAKKDKAATNKQNKVELLQCVEAYFTGDNAKVIKDATSELTQTYQRIRYALFQIKDNGYNGVKYDLIQTEIDGSKAFRLRKESK